MSTILSYPERRVEPELNLFVNPNADIVQGGYKWWANPAHLMYDCLSDYFVARNFFPDVKISLKSHKLGADVLNFFSALRPYNKPSTSRYLSVKLRRLLMNF
jgi:hypothetical protein